MRHGNDALLIVHLSSLDTFYDYGGPKVAYEVAAEMRADIETADSKGWPIFVLDRRWPTQGRNAKPRRELLEVLDDVYDYVWIGHDDGEEGTHAGIVTTLASVMKVFGVKRVYVIGGWYHVDDSEPLGPGCAGCVMAALAGMGFDVVPGTLLTMEAATAGASEYD